MDKLRRAWRHLLRGRWTVRRYFPRHALENIEATVRATEKAHPGEIRFAVEGALPLAAVLAGVTPRMRAVELFSQLGVWDTEHNNGVLIYLLLADRRIEIVADRGVAGGHVEQREWDECAEVALRAFRAGQFEQGAIAVIESVAALLSRHPPGTPGVRADVGNELPDRPAVL